MVQELWVGAAMLVGGLAGLRRGWRRQAADTAGCAAALALARWQHGRVLPYVQLIWAGPAIRQVALVYLFAVLYGLLRVLASLYVPSSRRPEAGRWIAGLIGAGQAGVLAMLTMTLLPQV
jgi:uncharacterized membrane protein required for colicin V production